MDVASSGNGVVDEAAGSQQTSMAVSGDMAASSDRINAMRKSNRQLKRDGMLDAFGGGTRVYYLRQLRYAS